MSTLWASSPPLALVVDDNPRVRQVVSLLLAQVGFEAVSLDDARDIVGQARRFRPTVIVLDLVLPVTDGATAVVRLREDPDTAHIPIVMITGHTQELERVRVRIEKGPIVFLAKPFTKAELHGAVTRALTPASENAS